MPDSDNCYVFRDKLNYIHITSIRGSKTFKPSIILMNWYHDIILTLDLISKQKEIKDPQLYAYILEYYKTIYDGVVKRLQEEYYEKTERLIKNFADSKGLVKIFLVEQEEDFLMIKKRMYKEKSKKSTTSKTPLFKVNKMMER